MPSLTAADAKKLLQFVAEAESLGGNEPFTEELLVELGRLIEADSVTYTEVDHIHRRSLVYLPRPGDEDDESVEITAEDWELMQEHPVCQQWRKDGRFYALRLSDVITQHELRQNRFFDQYFRPWGFEHELKVRLPSPPWHAKTFIFNRKRESREFTERDRLILDLLQPHLARLWQAAKTRRLLNAALAELDRADEQDPRGVILLGASTETEFVSPPAERLLREFFGQAAEGRLPPALADWLEADGDRPLIRKLDGRRLTVQRSEGALLLEERRDGIRLTAREREVVSWVARGKTNAEIAQLLWLAPSTVRKHLENVYAKLGVNTRTAAVARFLGLLDAEAEAS